MTTTTPGILGQLKPTANTDTNLFTVAYSNQAQFNIFICNQSGSQDQISVALVPSGSSETSISYILYNTPIDGNYAFTLGGLSLNSGDQVRVLSTYGTTSFTASGLTISS